MTSNSVTSNSVNLKQTLKTALDYNCACGPQLAAKEVGNILDIFNAWLCDQDARNSDGDPLRIDP